MKRLYTYIGLLLTINFSLVSFLLGQGSQNANSPWVIRLGWANDFVFQTDYYFTNGMSLEVWNNHLQSSPLNFVLLPHEDESKVFYGLSLHQDIFTPVNTDMALPQNMDRPYSSYWLMGNIKKSYNTDNTFVMTSGIYFGMIGKSGGGEVVQNGIHDILPTSAHVNGWDNQLSNSFCLDYQIGIEKEFYRNSLLRFSGSAGGMFGTPYTNLNGGFQVYFGQIGPYPDAFFTKEHADFQIYGFTKAETKWVLYNATLQGGLFNEDPSAIYASPNSLVFQLQIGMSARYKRFTMELGQNLITPEFPGAKIHKWGYVRFSYTL